MDEELRACIDAAVANHERSGSKPSDRNDPAVATGIFEALLPEPDPRSSVAQVLTDIIEHAHGQGAKKWAVTLFRDRVRLNVGAVHVCVVLRDTLFLVVNPNLIDEETRRALGPRAHKPTEFKSTGAALEVYLPMTDVARFWPSVQEASRAFVTTAASAGDTPFWPYHSPGVLEFLEDRLGRTLPRPVDRRQSDEPVDPVAVVARAKEDLPPERIEARERALAEARALLDPSRRPLSVDDLAQLMRWFNTDHYQGRDRVDRFGMAMTGHARNRISENHVSANTWINALWDCSSDEEVAAAIDRLRVESPLPFAGLPFPAMVLHCKEPQRFFPATASGTLSQGYERLVGTKPRDGRSYVTACVGLRDLVDEHDLTPMGLDIAAWFAANPQLVSGAETELEPELNTPEPGSAGYGRQQFLARTLFDDGELVEVERLLEDKPQLILYGPPGTGKTWIAEHLARFLTGDAPDQIQMLQFHPSYGYEDFIEGIRPTPDGDRVTYPVVPGVFREFCRRATEHPDLRYVLVVDEINRGNLPRIFGELLFALERRGTPVTLSQSREAMRVPHNLILLGTMNTADQSIALLDMALRRRFHFLRVEPNPEQLSGWLVSHGVSHMKPVAAILRALNLRLQGRGVARDRLVGHSHFMRPQLDEDTLPLIWRGSIIPLIEELFPGQDDIISTFDYETFVEPKLGRG